MKTITLISILTILFSACNIENDTKSNINIEANNTEAIKNSQTIDKIELPEKCNCDLGRYNRSFTTDLIFNNWENSEIKNKETFEKWSNDSLNNKVTSIRFSQYDTIPKRYAVFKNVERISIESRKGIYGLDIFPKLKSIHFFNSVIDLNSDEKWINKIKILIGQKTNFSGLGSFNKAQNLEVIYMAYSGFDEFPSDLDQLNCLTELTLGAYMFGEIDLEKLDLSQNQCLKKVEFQTWYNTLSGIPKGILESKIEELRIHHQKLTEIEKKEIIKIKNQLVKVDKQ